MAITVGSSAFTNGAHTTGFTLTIPACVAGDVLVLSITNRDATANPTVSDNDAGGNAWARKVSQNASTNGSGSVWWKRATSATAAKTITVGGCTGSSSGGVTVYSGVSIGTDPFDGTPVGEANASGNEGQAQITTARAGSLVCLSVFVTSNDTLNVATVTATDPTSLPERFEGTSSGGSDCSCSHNSAVKANAGATGALAWAMTNGTGASIAFALLAAPSALSAESGAFSLTGTAATLKRGLQVAADSGAWALSGQDVSFRKGITLTADAGSFAVSGTDAALRRTYVASAGAGSYALSGTAASLEYNRLVSASAGAYTLAGSDASLERGYALTAAVGAYTVTGSDAGLRTTRALGASAGSYALSGTSASLLRGYAVAAGSGSYALAGANVSLTYGSGSNDFTLSADGGAFTVSGATAALQRTYALGAESGSFILSGSSVGLTYTAGQGSVAVAEVQVTSITLLDALASSASLSDVTVTRINGA